MKQLFTLIFLFTTTINLFAQELQLEESVEKVSFGETKGCQAIHVGLPLVVVGAAFYPARENMQEIREEFIPNFHSRVDDYLQYGPAALMFGLKGFGVESRSSWERMLVSDAFAIGLTTITINILKQATKISRPDKYTSKTSSPSGHTATAFMTATMLHKEYGGVSLWYSVAGYSMATVTGAMRVANNRHWVSDVLVGAGIGILCTEAGYLIADAIFGDKGVNQELNRYSIPSWDNYQKTTSLGLYISAAQPLNQLYDDTRFVSSSRVGVEVSHHFNRYVGLGGRLLLSNVVTEQGDLVESGTGSFMGDAGLYFACPITKRWRASSKLVAGVQYFKECLMLPSMEGFSPTFGTGVGVEYLMNQHWAMKAFCDFDVTSFKMENKRDLYGVAAYGVSGSLVF